jgi:hypothetical protein
VLEDRRDDETAFWQLGDIVKALEESEAAREAA